MSLTLESAIVIPVIEIVLLQLQKILIVEKSPLKSTILLYRLHSDGKGTSLIVEFVPHHKIFLVSSNTTECEYPAYTINAFS